MRPRSVLASAPALLSLVLWFGATFFFLGNIGKHNEDYGMVMGDPALGSWNPIGAHPWLRFPYFFRPFLLAHSATINTVSWNHVWIGHLELAVIHAIAVWMLMGLLIRLGVRRQIAYGAALLFMTCPLMAEAVLWTTASCIPMGAIFLLRTLELARRQGAGPSSRVRALWIGLLAFMTACWYEPAAAALAAVPLVLLGGATRAHVPWRRCLRAAFQSTIAGALGCVLYAALLFATAPSKNRGGAQSFVGRANFLPHARGFLSEVATSIIGPRGRGIINGSVHEGWHTLHTPGGWVWLALAGVLVPLAALAMVGRASASASGTPKAPSDAAPSGRGLLALGGVVIFFAAWLPIIVVEDQAVELRSIYVPLIGLTLLGAALANGAAGAFRDAAPGPRSALGFLALAAALSAALAGAIGLIGFQTQFRLDARHDTGAVKRLHRLVPDPPPNTVFVPLSVALREVDTGHPSYDHAIRLAKSWPARALVRTAYGRADITITPTAGWLSKPDATGFRYLRYSARVQWERCIPFTIDRNGEVHLVRRLMVAPGGAAPFDVEFPRVPASAASGVGDSAPLRLREGRRGRCVLEDASSPFPRPGGSPDTEPPPDRMVP